MRPMSEPAFRVKTVTPTRVAVIRATVRQGDLGETISELLSKVWAYLSGLPSVTVGPALVHYLAWGPAGYELQVGFPVGEPVPAAGPVESTELPGGPAATLIHLGPYDRLPAAYAELESWMRREGHVPDGLPWEIYWVDASHVDDPGELRTEIVWPLRALPAASPSEPTGRSEQPVGDDSR